MPAADTASEPSQGRAAPRIHRRVFHLTAGSIFPTAYVFLDKDLVLPAAIALAGAAVVLELARFRAHGFNRLFLKVVSPLTKSSEGSAVLGSTWMLIATPICIGLMDQPFAVLALYYLSLGDPAAAIVGERFGSTRIGDKSVEGSAAFLVVSAAIGSLLLETKLDTTYSVMIIGAGVATLTELAATRGLDDNLKTPLIAGAFMELAARWLA